MMTTPKIDPSIPNSTVGSYAVAALEPVWSAPDGRYLAQVRDSKGEVVGVCLRNTKEEARRAALAEVKRGAKYGHGLRL